MSIMMPISPSGRQHHLHHGALRAVITEVGAGAGYVGPGQLRVGTGVIALDDSSFDAQFGFYDLDQVGVGLGIGIAEIRGAFGG